MAAKQLKFDSEARQSILIGVEKPQQSSESYPRTAWSQCDYRQKIRLTDRHQRWSQCCKGNRTG